MDLVSKFGDKLMAISLNPGDKLRRRELHERFGGRQQGGISPSRVSPNVFLFTNQAQGALHGYIYDGFHDDAPELRHAHGEPRRNTSAM